MNTVDEIKKTAGDLRIIDKAAEREMYSHDIGDLPPVVTRTLFQTVPDLVVQRRSVDEIRKVLAFANEKSIPVIPRGAASWGFGGVVPTKGGIVIDLSPFRRILAIDTAAKRGGGKTSLEWGWKPNLGAPMPPSLRKKRSAQAFRNFKGIFEKLEKFSS